VSGRHAGPRPRSFWLTLWTFELAVFEGIRQAIEAIRDERNFLLQAAGIATLACLVLSGAVLVMGAV